MRLTCPNCGAQYEVPEEVIPEAGRDVQCSNCGDTWFQTRHGAEDDAMTGLAEEAGWVEPEPEAPTPEPVAETSPAPGQEPEAEPGPATPTAQAREERSAPSRRGIEPEVANVLREEASREQQARAAETANLETQPDLGLSGNAPEDQRAQQARARMARLRGEAAGMATTTTAAAAAAAVTAMPKREPAADVLPDEDIDDDLLSPGTRRNLLPDVEEINSSIAANPDDTSADTSARDGTRTQTMEGQKNGGFVRGIAVAVIVAFVAIGPYAYAPQIKAAVPGVAASLDAYVATIDKGRVALETQLGGLPQTIREMLGST